MLRAVLCRHYIAMIRKLKPKPGTSAAVAAAVPVAAVPAAARAAATTAVAVAPRRRPGELLEQRAAASRRAPAPRVDIAGVIDRLTDWQLGPRA